MVSLENVKRNSAPRIHADASRPAIPAVVYLRVRSKTGLVNIIIFSSKTKVAAMRSLQLCAGPLQG